MLIRAPATLVHAMARRHLRIPCRSPSSNELSPRLAYVTLAFALAAAALVLACEPASVAPQWVWFK